MDMHALLVSSPIDRVARRVTSQRGLATSDTPLSREELAFLVQRLARKQRLLKRVLGIETKAQHKNTVYKANNGIPQFRSQRHPPALVEYLRCGRETQRLTTELAAMRKARRFVAEAQREYLAGVEA